MASQYERDYAKLVERILLHGNDRPTRNHPTKSIFGETLTVYDLIHGQFPILNGRKIFYKGVLAELAAFLKGPKTLEDFEKEGCNYWKNWANEDGTIDVDYGNTWLDFNGVNQLEEVLGSLATDPNGRRHIISGWKPDNLPFLSLPCCHMLYQWYVNGEHLEMIWYQRSVDTMIGLPSDVILAAAWNILMAEQLNLLPGKLVFMLGDTHIYQSHIPNAKVYLNKLDTLSSHPVGYFNEGTLYDFNKESIQLIDYNPLKPINFELH